MKLRWKDTSTKIFGFTLYYKYTLQYKANTNSDWKDVPLAD